MKLEHALWAIALAASLAMAGCTAPNDSASGNSSSGGGSSSGSSSSGSSSGSSSSSSSSGGTVSGDLRFNGAYSYFADYAPQSITTGDVNGDGHTDLVIAAKNGSTQGTGAITVLLGQGDGTFAVGNGAQGINGPTSANGLNAPINSVLVDLNNDGNLDLVVLNAGSNNASSPHAYLSTYLNDGRGNFILKDANIDVSDTATGLTAGDFNHDGNPDVIVVGRISGIYRVYDGDGTGNLTLANTVANSGGNPLPVAVANLQGATGQNLVMVGGNQVNVLTGKGDNTFSTQTYTVATNQGNSLVAVTVADMNNDGRPDIVAADYSTNQVFVLLQDASGNGQFDSPAAYPVGVHPTAVVARDVNGDLKADVMVTNGAFDSVSVLLNDGNGGLKPAQNYAVQGSPSGLITGDFNEDHKSDLAVTNADNASVSILLGAGDGSFIAGRSIANGQLLSASSVTVLDADNDGNLDLAVPDSAYAKVAVFRGNGDGSFKAQEDYLVGNGPNAIVHGQFRSNGASQDLAVTDATNNVVYILLNNGSGSYSVSPTSYPVGNSPGAIAVSDFIGREADFNGDGITDLAIANTADNTVTILLGNGSGGFTVDPHGPFPVGQGPDAIVVGDFNNDGKFDVATANINSTVSVLLGNGDGSFQSSVNSPGPAAVFIGMAVTQFPGDTFPGLIAVGASKSNQNQSGVYALLSGKGDGSFNQVNSTGTGGINNNVTYAVATADLNGDGFPDALTTDTYSAVVSLLLGGGSSGFAPPTTKTVYDVGNNPMAIALGDFNNDGKLDFVTVGKVPYGSSLGIVLQK